MELKFRVWGWTDMAHTIKGWKVFTLEDLMYHPDGDSAQMLNRQGDTDPEQFTGLKDKNNREIYIGDILSFQFPFGEPIRGKVEFGEYEDAEDYQDSKHYGYFVKYMDENGITEWRKTLIDIHKDAIIIGNIHETPELAND